MYPHHSADTVYRCDNCPPAFLCDDCANRADQESFIYERPCDFSTPPCSSRDVVWFDGFFPTEPSPVLDVGPFGFPDFAPYVPVDTPLAVGACKTHLQVVSPFSSIDAIVTGLGFPLGLTTYTDRNTPAQAGGFPAPPMLERQTADSLFVECVDFGSDIAATHLTTDTEGNHVRLLFKPINSAAIGQASDTCTELVKQPAQQQYALVSVGITVGDRVHYISPVF
jgi:hypothetical protein